MKAKALGRFVADFIEGLIGDDAPAAAPAPMVIPTDAVKQAVAEFLQPMIDAESDPPTGPQLDLFTHNIEHAEPAPSDPAEMIRQRVAEANALSEQRRVEAEPPPGWVDPNMPGNVGWAGPRPG